MTFDLNDLFGGDGGDDEGIPLSSMHALMDRILSDGAAGKIDSKDAIRMLFAVMWPEHSPDCQDIRPSLAMFFAMHDRMDLTPKIVSAYLINAGPILGLAIASDPDQGELTDIDHDLIANALAVVMKAGGLEVNERDGKLFVRRPGEDSVEQRVDIDVEVGKFRAELDDQLGPSIDPENPWTRWLG